MLSFIDFKGRNNAEFSIFIKFIYYLSSLKIKIFSAQETSFLAQQYSSEESAVFGVWLHGKAGDFTAEKHSKESMLPSDLIDELGNVFKILS
ncbi:hypothetical protein H0S70_00550 [Chryseobacterium manosquense]|uniref:YjeF C-terminal domain-containing protein n=1 Tax=Chryseobacterium manosquense TaxID=2754694 RepID=A0A7H1E0A4_9FLAO|nr:hypothetical protein H0S70_00550 [Chryseobacterium manosquense]